LANHLVDVVVEVLDLFLEPPDVPEDLGPYPFGGNAQAIPFGGDHLQQLVPTVHQGPRSSRVSSSGRGRTGGWITAANCASTWASMTSVFADLPVARAKLRTCRGLTSDIGNPASCSSTATNVSYPPVASNTTPVGFTDAAYSTSAITPIGIV
jgi:hypothetical protein